MTWFETSTASEAVIDADRADVWSVLTDADVVAELTPFVQRITVDGDHWHWELDEVPGLGVSLAPAFTVRMRLDDGERITFEHDPPEGERERAAVEGVYELADASDGGPGWRST
ncbi:hypothetical protein HMPREF0063_10025 [Aeromicrobium marinum DSM 15272]|uniref:Polyketide cyclase/dehydrase n=1 Tax=Aeromicrobium marinum DSM 15272 TaxID=585531 RepID=E2S7L8_9ACTN|nr:hypothetical protein [Aeromicrobium marinum]EFQ84684.1 hypothetical protein HMPREF0063_10025 [Aeromicrobium marinum DSM 15272]